VDLLGDAAATVTLGGLIPNGIYRLADNGSDQGSFIASEIGSFGLETVLDRKHVYKTDIIAQ
jgi:hypothetical protein